MDVAQILYREGYICGENDLKKGINLRSRTTPYGSLGSPVGVPELAAVPQCAVALRGGSAAKERACDKFRVGNGAWRCGARGRGGARGIRRRDYTEYKRPSLETPSAPHGGGARGAHAGGVPGGVRPDGSGTWANGSGSRTKSWSGRGADGTPGADVRWRCAQLRRAQPRVP